MAAEEAVFTAATARNEVRKSLSRLEYHLARGARGVRGVEREVAFLDALGRQSARLGALTAYSGQGSGAGRNVTAKIGLGQRAEKAMKAQAAGSGATAGRLKSSLLAEYSQDTMRPSREWTEAPDWRGDPQKWLWVANASACPACLSQHGLEHEGGFVQMHPSCLCYPAEPATREGTSVTPLTQPQLVNTLLRSNNTQFARVGKQLETGSISVEEAAAAATRQSARGLARWEAAIEEQTARQAAQAFDDAVAAGAPAGPADDTLEASVAYSTDPRISFIDKAKIQEIGAWLDENVPEEIRPTLNKVLENTRKVGVLRDIPDSNTLAMYIMNDSPATRSLALSMRGQSATEIRAWRAAMNKAYREEVERLKGLGFKDQAGKSEVYAEMKRNNFTAKWKEANPEPAVVERSVEEMGATFVHELGHGLDATFGVAQVQLPNGLTQGPRFLDTVASSKFKFKQIADDVAKAFESGEHPELWYAATKPSECFAELFRMYTLGEPKLGMTGAQWREAFPQWAKGIKEVLAQ